MNALDPSNLDADTKTRLTRLVADLVAGEIDTERLGPSYTRTDPGSRLLYVNDWWAEVLTDGYNAMSRLGPDHDIESVEGLHLHGVPVEIDEQAHIPTVREPADPPVWKRDHEVACPDCGRTYSGEGSYVTHPGSCEECGADLTQVLPTPTEGEGR